MARKAQAAAAAQAAPLEGFLDRLAAKLLHVKAHPEDAPRGELTAGNPVSLSPRVPDVETWVGDMVTGVKNSGAKWKRNTLAPTKSPLVEAKKAGPKFEASMRQALDEKRFEAGIDAVDEAAMYDTIRATPDSTYVEGVTRRTSKIKSRVTRMRPLLLTLLNEEDQLANATEADRDNKVLAHIRGMRALGKALRTR
jgi:hypothetical protein